MTRWLTFERKFHHVLDPTMLLTKEDYITSLHLMDFPESNGTLFCYILDPSETISSLIHNIEKATGYSQFYVQPKHREDYLTKAIVKKHIDDCIYPKVQQWVRSFMDAEMTVVDSFHGMVFSIIFNKPFWVIANNGRGLSRFTSLLSVLGLEDRIIRIEDLKSEIKYNKEIDWRIVNLKLESWRSQSLSLLNSKLYDS